MSTRPTNGKRVTNAALATLIEELTVKIDATDSKVDQIRDTQNRIDTQLRGDGDQKGHHERIRVLEDIRVHGLEKWKDEVGQEQTHDRRLAKGAIWASGGSIGVALILGLVTFLTRG